MNNKGNIQTREELLRSILDGFVRSGVGAGNQGTIDHLDEDTISAFVKGNLSRREATPATAHLVSCGFCRHRTAELVRLDSEFAGESEAPSVSMEPSKVSDVLSGILGKLFGAGEGAVFAHEEKGEESDREEERNK